MIAPLRAGIVALSMLCASGCAWWQKKGPVITPDAQKLVACVLSHYGEDPRVVAVQCGAESVQVVVDIFTAQRAAMAKAAASGANK